VLLALEDERSGSGHRDDRVAFDYAFQCEGALDEVVVHGWDLARSTGQDFEVDDAAAATCLSFVESFDVPAEESGGLFGPPVSVPDDADPLTRLIAATGRDPSWAP